MVVSYRNSTSNHNRTFMLVELLVLYLIEILHQTTTSRWENLLWMCCILSKFYIKPQRWEGKRMWIESCILSKFYIKPQLYRKYIIAGISCILSKFYIKPQLLSCFHVSTLRCILSKFYIKPQRNHRAKRIVLVVSYRNSTSNHNIFDY